MQQCDSSTIYYSDYNAITQQMRCPVCDGQRIESSNAIFAQNLKRDICTHLRSGTPPSDVIATLEAEYGQSLRVSSGFEEATFPLILMTSLMIIAAAFAMRKLL